MLRFSPGIHLEELRETPKNYCEEEEMLNCTSSLNVNKYKFSPSLWEGGETDCRKLCNYEIHNLFSS